ncbi:MAG TPA: alkaline phosphatase family protein [Gaiellaceae bacterium]|nr:alkaline phosphatase family protein [Gaiellaceae bacterium]
MTLRIPEYGTRCFDALPGTIERLLTGAGDGLRLGAPLLEQRYDHVVLVYLDGFGWRFAERHAHHPLLRGADLVERLTSQFPSTTVVHTATIHTGLPVGAHGLYEWFVYDPGLDRLISPLIFAFAGDDARNTLLAAGLGPEDVYPAESLYARLAAEGVACHVAHPAPIAHTPPSRWLLRGTTVHGFDAAEDGLAAVGAALAREERGYGLVYLPEVDTMMHLAGTDDPAAVEAFDAALSAVERAARSSVFPPGTLVLLTSDHGMADISPERTTYVNVVWPGIAELLVHGADGKPLAPAGSCRDLFLHVRPGCVDEVVARLRVLLAETADVYAVDDLVAAGVFGPEVTAALRRRLADVVCLPREGEAVYWLEPGRFEQTFLGQHGGLSADELEIPLVALVAD